MNNKFEEVILQKMKDKDFYDIEVKNIVYQDDKSCHMLVDFKWDLNGWNKQIIDFTAIAYINDKQEIKVLI